MSIFDSIAKVIGLGDKHAGYGVIEGSADAATQMIQDDDERLNDNISRLTEIRQRRLLNEETKYNKEYNSNFEEVKALAASLGPNGTDILHSLIIQDNRGYAGAKALVPTIVTKATSENRTVEDILDYTQRKEGKNITAKQLTDIVTTPMNVPDFDMGTVLQGTGSDLLNLIAGAGSVEKGAGSVEKYTEKQVKQQMAIAGFGEDFGKTEKSDLAIEPITVDLFELNLVGTIDQKIKMLNDAFMNTSDNNEKKKYSNRISELTIRKNILGESKLLSTSALNREIQLTLADIAKSQNLTGTFDSNSGRWINQGTEIERVNEGTRLATNIISVVESSKMIPSRSDGRPPQGYLEASVSSEIQDIADSLGIAIAADISVTQLKGIATTLGYNLKLVSAKDSSTGEPYLTLGSKFVFTPPSNTGLAGGNSGGTGSNPFPKGTSNAINQHKNTISKISPQAGMNANQNAARKALIIIAIQNSHPNAPTANNITQNYINSIPLKQLEKYWKDNVGYDYDSSMFNNKTINDLS